jgi:hypothetical protein
MFRAIIGPSSTKVGVFYISLSLLIVIVIIICMLEPDD